MLATSKQVRPLSVRSRRVTAPPLPSRQQSQLDVKRWGTAGQPAVAWDGLRRDLELWSYTGDCTVYLYARGQSQRSPSFKVSYHSLYAARCAEALLAASSHAYSDRSSPFESPYYTPVTSPLDSPRAAVKLYLPAPSHLNREDAYRYHLTTRNFFAWLQGKALVGESLGWALVNLVERIQQWVFPATDAIQEVVQYADLLSYTDFVDLPVNALAMLYFAETYKERALWIDAFAHCVGMIDSLPDSCGHELISRKSKALMSRAYLEMDLHIGRAYSSIATFLEEELSSTHLGLLAGARSHLDNFRTFLLQFCVAKYGYWPPPRTGTYNRELFTSMLEDFSALYGYLADTRASGTRNYAGATGGVCVVQNVEAFNARHRLPPLPYSLPLMPQLGEQSKSLRPSRGLLHLRGNSKDCKLSRIMTARHGLENATNRDDKYVMDCSFVQAYAEFEGELAVRCDENVTIVEARKVRWLLVYGMLQTLTSISQTPPEVRHSANAPYALCVLTEGCPPWNAVGTPLPTQQDDLQPRQFDIRPTTPPTPPTTLQPDCEFGDYFAYIPKHNVDGSVVSRPPSPPPRKSPMRRLSTLRRASIHLSKQGRTSSTRSRTTSAISLRQYSPTPDSPVSKSSSRRSPAPSLSWSAEGADSSCTDDEGGPPYADDASSTSIKDLDFDLAEMIAKAQTHAPDLKSHPAFNTVDAFLDEFLVTGFEEHHI